MRAPRAIVLHALISFFIRLEDRLPPNIGFTLRGSLAVFTRSAITPPKVNRLGWNLEYSENIVGGLPWKISGAIRAVATLWEADDLIEILFFSCPVNNARFHRFPVGQITTTFEQNNVDRCSDENYRNRILKNSSVRGSFSQKRKNFSQKFQHLATSGGHNYVMITYRQKFTTKWSVYGMSRFPFLANVTTLRSLYAIAIPSVCLSSVCSESFHRYTDRRWPICIS